MVLHEFNSTPELIKTICNNFHKNISINLNPNDDESKIEYVNNVDIAWMLSASILVMLMTPAVGFLYGGLVKKSSILFIMSQCFAIFALVSLIWAVVGYSITFGPSLYGFIGDPTKYFLLWNLSNDNKCFNERKMKNYTDDIYPYPSSCSIPESLFFIFQAKFAGITPTLIVGSMSDRMKFHNILIFMSIWVVLVYCLLTHWIWNEDGWLSAYFYITDFAGGTVVHMAAGFSSLAIAFFIGKRKNQELDVDQNNIPLMVLGTMLLWFGWFGFNGGSSFQADFVAVNAILSTNLAATGGMVSWMLCEYLNTKNHPTIIGISFGTICGLISITPVAGYINPILAIIIGGIGSLLSFLVSNKWHWIRNRVDDLDIFACHGISGAWGSFSAALFASSKYNFYLYRRDNNNGKIIYDLDGIFYKFSFYRIFNQSFGLIVTAVYSLVMTLLILKLLEKLGMRIREDILNIDHEFLPPRLAIIEDEESDIESEPQKNIIQRSSKKLIVEQNKELEINN